MNLLRSVFEKGWNNAGYIFRLSLYLIFSIFAGSVYAQVVSYPTFGTENSENQYLIRKVQIYAEDFEKPDAVFNLQGENLTVIEGTADVLNGNKSLKFGEGLGTFTLPPAALSFEAGKTYIIEYDYYVKNYGAWISALSTVVIWNGVEADQDRDLYGPFKNVAPDMGRIRHAVRVGSADTTVTFEGRGAEIIIDDIRIYRHDNQVKMASPLLLKAGFPRLSNYNLFSLFSTSLRTGVELSEITETLGLYDFITGLESEFTLGYVGDSEVLKQINPDIVLLPYIEPFVSQFDNPALLGDSAGLSAQYLLGLEDAWFLKNTSGERLNQPYYPGNFQMNHTRFGAVIDGVSYRDYAVRYLTDAILPSGLWDGIHFDESIWYPNPLLSQEDPFNSHGGELPPIDLNEDGVAESYIELSEAWRDAFQLYFDDIHRSLGYSRFLFGNAGEIPDMPAILSTMNGMTREYTRPYKLDDNQDSLTDFTGGWYDLFRRYRMAEAHLRGPQIPTFQFTGSGLGIPTGLKTDNGLDNREPVLEARDYPRMRLGLTTMLLGDGFFGYDYVDNTTAPTWFDEYAVDSSGMAVKDVSAKGYLGQPLGPAEELEYPRETLFRIDFDQTPIYSAGVMMGDSLEVTTNPNEVIDGQASLKFSSDGFFSDGLIFATSPEELELEQGEIYQLMFDYRVLEARQDFEPGFLVASISDPVSGVDYPFRSSILWYPDNGQKGFMRVGAKIHTSGMSADIQLVNAGTVVIDNLHFLKGRGGVFRRDFENGIVLVNPHPNPVSLSQAELQGQLGRSGIKRILGAQDPLTNSGAVILNGLDLPPGDGIILLADPIIAPAPRVPGALSARSNEHELKLTWEKAEGTVAGYIVRYGLQGGDLTQFAITGISPEVELQHLEAGAVYQASVSAFDYLGNQGPDSEISSFATQGAAVNRPVLNALPALAPGNLVTLSGSELADVTEYANAPYPVQLGGVEVFVNGLSAPITHVTPTLVGFIVPWEVVGESAVIRLVNRGVTSASHLTDLWLATPYLWSWGDSGLAIALDEASQTAISSLNPAKRDGVVSLIVSGLGILEPVPANGAMISDDTEPFHAIQVSISGVAIEPIDTSLFLGALGFYKLQLRIPDMVPGGLQGVELSIAGISSNVASLYIEEQILE